MPRVLHFSTLVSKVAVASTKVCSILYTSVVIILSTVVCFMTAGDGTTINITEAGDTVYLPLYRTTHLSINI